MGCDWHPYLEKRTESGWSPLWEPELDEKWYLDIMYESTSAGEILSFSTESEKVYAALEKYFTSLSKEQIIEKFNNDPRVCWIWKEHYYKTVNYSFDLKCRDYNWFSALAGVRCSDEHSGYCDYIGLPLDMSHRVAMEYEKGKEDYHTCNWVMVSELLNSPLEKFRKFRQIEWLRKNVHDPENTRLIFWFDN